MKTKNIYFSGPDGSRKTSMAFATKFFLETRDNQSLVISFPSKSSAAYPLLRLDLDGRIHLGAGAKDLLFVADRLNMAVRLQKIRRKHPDTVFIFDRGPADGAVYAAVSDLLREEPLELTISAVEKWDSKFLKMFPVDLGIYLRSSIKSADMLMQMRESYKPSDEVDRNIVLQQRIREVFDTYMEGRSGWKVLNVDPEIKETSDDWGRRIMVGVLGLVSESAGHPEWLKTKNFRREIDEISKRTSEQPSLVYKEGHTILSFPVSRERH